MVLGSSDQIAKLTQLSLEADLVASERTLTRSGIEHKKSQTVAYFVEKFDQINVVAGAFKVLLQENENARFQDKRVVNGNGSNTILAVPARLTTTGDRGVHHIISDEEVGLQLMEKKRIPGN